MKAASLERDCLPEPPTPTNKAWPPSFSTCAEHRPALARRVDLSRDHEDGVAAAWRRVDVFMKTTSCAEHLPSNAVMDLVLFEDAMKHIVPTQC